MNSYLKQNIYKPTVKEGALLEILINPENHLKSITDICRLAECSRVLYYEALKKQGFREIYFENVKDLLMQSIGPIMNTFIKEAVNGSFQHGKVLLEMAGLYSTQQRVELSGDMSVNAMTLEQQREAINEMLKRELEDIREENKEL